MQEVALQSQVSQKRFKFRRRKVDEQTNLHGHSPCRYFKQLTIGNAEETRSKSTSG